MKYAEREEREEREYFVGTHNCVLAELEKWEKIGMLQVYSVGFEITISNGFPHKQTTPLLAGLFEKS